MTDAVGYLRAVAEAESESDAARWAAAAALWEQVVARNPVNRDVAMEAILVCHRHLTGGRPASAAGR